MNLLVLNRIIQFFIYFFTVFQLSSNNLYAAEKKIDSKIYEIAPNIINVKGIVKVKVKGWRLKTLEDEAITHPNDKDRAERIKKSIGKKVKSVTEKLKLTYLSPYVLVADFDGDAGNDFAAIIFNKDHTPKSKLYVLLSNGEEYEIGGTSEIGEWPDALAPLAPGIYKNYCSASPPVIEYVGIYAMTPECCGGGVYYKWFGESKGIKKIECSE